MGPKAGSGGGAASGGAESAEQMQANDSARAVAEACLEEAEAVHSEMDSLFASGQKLWDTANQTVASLGAVVARRYRMLGRIRSAALSHSGKALRKTLIHITDDTARRQVVSSMLQNALAAALSAPGWLSAAASVESLSALRAVQCDSGYTVCEYRPPPVIMPRPGRHQVAASRTSLVQRQHTLADGAEPSAQVALRVPPDVVALRVFPAKSQAALRDEVAGIDGPLARVATDQVLLATPNPHLYVARGLWRQDVTPADLDALRLTHVRPGNAVHCLVHPPVDATLAELLRDQKRLARQAAAAVAAGTASRQDDDYLMPALTASGEVQPRDPDESWRRPLMNQRNVVWIALQVASALADMQDAAVAHFTLSPESILLQQPPRHQRFRGHCRAMVASLSGCVVCDGGAGTKKARRKGAEWVPRPEERLCLTRGAARAHQQAVCGSTGQASAAVLAPEVEQGLASKSAKVVHLQKQASWALGQLMRAMMKAGSQARTTLKKRASLLDVGEFSPELEYLANRLVDTAAEKRLGIHTAFRQLQVLAFVPELAPCGGWCDTAFMADAARAAVDCLRDGLGSVLLCVPPWEWSAWDYQLCRFTATHDSWVALGTTFSDLSPLNVAAVLLSEHVTTDGDHNDGTPGANRFRLLLRLLLGLVPVLELELELELGLGLGLLVGLELDRLAAQVKVVTRRRRNARRRGDASRGLCLLSVGSSFVRIPRWG